MVKENENIDYGLPTYIHKRVLIQEVGGSSSVVFLTIMS